MNFIKETTDDFIILDKRAMENEFGLLGESYVPDKIVKEISKTLKLQVVGELERRKNKSKYFKDYYEKNKKVFQQRAKDIYKKNRSIRLECSCGKLVSKSNWKSHQTTKVHETNVKLMNQEETKVEQKLPDNNFTEIKEDEIEELII